MIHFARAALVASGQSGVEARGEWQEKWLIGDARSPERWQQCTPVMAASTRRFIPFFPQKHSQNSLIFARNCVDMIDGKL